MILYFSEPLPDLYGVKLCEEETDPEVRKRYEKPLSDEQGNPIHEWAVKPFFLNQTECLQAVHFASRFTVILIGMDGSNMKDAGAMIAGRLVRTYREEPEIAGKLRKMFREHPFPVWARLNDERGRILLKQNERIGIREPGFYRNFVQDGVLSHDRLHAFLNFNFEIPLSFRGKSQYGCPGDFLRESVKELPD